MLELIYGDYGGGYNIIYAAGEAEGKAIGARIVDGLPLPYRPDRGLFAERAPRTLTYWNTTFGRKLGAPYAVLAAAGRQEAAARGTYYRHAVGVPCSDALLEHSFGSLFEGRMASESDCDAVSGGAKPDWQRPLLADAGGPMRPNGGLLRRDQMRAILMRLFQCVQDVQLNSCAELLIVAESREEYEQKALRLLREVYCYLPYDLRRIVGFCTFSEPSAARLGSVYLTVSPYEPECFAYLPSAVILDGRDLDPFTNGIRMKDDREKDITDAVEDVVQYLLDADFAQREGFFTFARRSIRRLSENDNLFFARPDTYGKLVAIPRALGQKPYSEVLADWLGVADASGTSNAGVAEKMLVGDWICANISVDQINAYFRSLLAETSDPGEFEAICLSMEKIHGLIPDYAALANDSAGWIGRHYLEYRDGSDPERMERLEELYRWLMTLPGADEPYTAAGITAQTVRLAYAAAKERVLAARAEAERAERQRNEDALERAKGTPIGSFDELLAYLRTPPDADAAYGERIWAIRCGRVRSFLAGESETAVPGRYPELRRALQEAAGAERGTEAKALLKRLDLVIRTKSRFGTDADSIAEAIAQCNAPDLTKNEQDYLAGAAESALWDGKVRADALEKALMSRLGGKPLRALYREGRISDTQFALAASALAYAQRNEPLRLDCDVDAQKLQRSLHEIAARWENAGEEKHKSVRAEGVGSGLAAEELDRERFRALYSALTFPGKCTVREFEQNRAVLLALIARGDVPVETIDALLTDEKLEPRDRMEILSQYVRAYQMPVSKQAVAVHSEAEAERLLRICRSSNTRAATYVKGILVSTVPAPPPRTLLSVLIGVLPPVLTVIAALIACCFGAPASLVMRIAAPVLLAFGCFGAVLNAGGEGGNRLLLAVFCAAGVLLYLAAVLIIPAELMLWRLLAVALAVMLPIGYTTAELFTE